MDPHPSYVTAYTLPCVGKVVFSRPYAYSKLSKQEQRRAAHLATTAMEGTPDGTRCLAFSKGTRATSLCPVAPHELPVVARAAIEEGFEVDEVIFNGAYPARLVMDVEWAIDLEDYPATVEEEAALKQRGPGVLIPILEELVDALLAIGVPESKTGFIVSEACRVKWVTLDKKSKKKKLVYKWSYHVTCRDVLFEEWKDQKVFLMECLSEESNKYIDKTIYNNYRGLRIVASRKCEEGTNSILRELRPGCDILASGLCFEPRSYKLADTLVRVDYDPSVHHLVPAVVQEKEFKRAKGRAKSGVRDRIQLEADLDHMQGVLTQS